MYAKSLAPAGALAVLLIAATSSQAQSSELGAFGNAPAMQDATKIILVPGPGLSYQQVELGQAQSRSAAGSARAASTGSSATSLGGFAHLEVGAVLPRPDVIAEYKLDRKLEVFAYGPVSDSSASTATSILPAINWKRPIDPENQPPSVYGNLSGYQAHPGSQGGGSGTQVVSHVGDPQQKSSAGEGPRSLGNKRSIQLGPLPASQGGGGIEPVHEPGSLDDVAQAMGMREVLLSGRPGTPYAVVLTFMGSANAPSILIGEGMLFGEDPSQGPRTIAIQVPAEFGVQLIPLGQK